MPSYLWLHRYSVSAGLFPCASVSPDSTYPFSQGLPGSIKSVVTPTRSSHSDCGAGERGHRELVGDRRRRAAGSEPRARDRGDDVRQGIRANRLTLEGGTGLRLTTALYHTPSGRSIQEVGIAPDTAVDSVPASEVTEGRTLPPGRELEGDDPNEGITPQAATGTRDSEPAPAGESDVQLDRALEVLKRVTLFERQKQGPASDDRAALPGGLGVVGLDAVRLNLPRGVAVARLGFPLLLLAERLGRINAMIRMAGKTAGYFLPISIQRSTRNPTTSRKHRVRRRS